MRDRRGLQAKLGQLQVANCLQAMAKGPRGWGKGGMDSEDPETQSGSGQWRTGKQTLNGGKMSTAGGAATA